MMTKIKNDRQVCMNIGTKLVAIFRIATAHSDPGISATVACVDLYHVSHFYVPGKIQFYHLISVTFLARYNTTKRRVLACYETSL